VRQQEHRQTQLDQAADKFGVPLRLWQRARYRQRLVDTIQAVARTLRMKQPLAALHNVRAEGSMILRAVEAQDKGEGSARRAVVALDHRIPGGRIFPALS
jgi:hypothetical protein